jgi:hypothetical protein
METHPSSHCPNNMEAACNLMANYISSTNCARGYTGEKGLLVAIVNSDFNRFVYIPAMDD